jgi:hypothetical protein
MFSSLKSILSKIYKKAQAVPLPIDQDDEYYGGDYIALGYDSEQEMIFDMKEKAQREKQQNVQQPKLQPQLQLQPQQIQNKQEPQQKAVGRPLSVFTVRVLSDYMKKWFDKDNPLSNVQPEPEEWKNDKILHANFDKIVRSVLSGRLLIPGTTKPYIDPPLSKGMVEQVMTAIYTAHSVEEQKKNTETKAQSIDIPQDILQIKGFEELLANTDLDVRENRNPLVVQRKKEQRIQNIKNLAVVLEQFSDSIEIEKQAEKNVYNIKLVSPEEMAIFYKLEDNDFVSKAKKQIDRAVGFVQKKLQRALLQRREEKEETEEKDDRELERTVNQKINDIGELGGEILNQVSIRPLGRVYKYVANNGKINTPTREDYAMGFFAYRDNAKYIPQGSTIEDLTGIYANTHISTPQEAAEIERKRKPFMARLAQLIDPDPNDKVTQEGNASLIQYLVNKGRDQYLRQIQKDLGINLGFSDDEAEGRSDVVGNITKEQTPAAMAGNKDTAWEALRPFASNKQGVGGDGNIISYAYDSFGKQSAEFVGDQVGLLIAKKKVGGKQGALAKSKKADMMQFMQILGERQVEELFRAEKLKKRKDGFTVASNEVGQIIIDPQGNIRKWKEIISAAGFKFYWDKFCKIKEALMSKDIMNPESVAAGDNVLIRILSDPNFRERTQRIALEQNEFSVKQVMEYYSNTHRDWLKDNWADTLTSLLRSAVESQKKINAMPQGESRILTEARFLNARRMMLGIFCVHPDVAIEDDSEWSIREKTNKYGKERLDGIYGLYGVKMSCRDAYKMLVSGEIPASWAEKERKTAFNILLEGNAVVSDLMDTAKRLQKFGSVDHINKIIASTKKAYMDRINTILRS